MVNNVIKRDLTYGEFMRVENKYNGVSNVECNYLFNSEDVVCVLYLNKSYRKRISKMKFRYNLIDQGNMVKLVIFKSERSLILDFLSNVEFEEGTSSLFSLMTSPGKNKYFYAFDSALKRTLEKVGKNSIRLFAYPKSDYETILVIKKRDYPKVRRELEGSLFSVSREDMFRSLVNSLNEECLNEKAKCI